MIVGWKVADDVSIWKTELRRGLVELSVLLVLQQGEAYGYEIVERLRDDADLEFTESTVYPVLSRLHRQSYLSLRRGPSPTGPPRRYFRLTAAGRKRLQSMIQQWRVLNERIENLLQINLEDK